MTKAPSFESPLGRPCWPTRPRPRRCRRILLAQYELVSAKTCGRLAILLPRTTSAFGSAASAAHGGSNQVTLETKTVAAQRTLTAMRRAVTLGPESYVGTNYSTDWRRSESACQWTWITAKRNAVLMPNSSTPFTASRTLILCHRGASVIAGISNVVIVARE